jgi:hypothetical protein
MTSLISNSILTKRTQGTATGGTGGGGIVIIRYLI